VHHSRPLGRARAATLTRASLRAACRRCGRRGRGCRADRGAAGRGSCAAAGVRAAVRCYAGAAAAPGLASGRAAAGLPAAAIWVRALNAGSAERFCRALTDFSVSLHLA
jgi:hypothetical protein